MRTILSEIKINQGHLRKLKYILSTILHREKCLYVELNGFIPLVLNL